MTANTPIDRALKNGLLDDTLTIVNMEKLYIIINVEYFQIRTSSLEDLMKSTKMGKGQKLE
jgi:hypothetical protein